MQGFALKPETLETAQMAYQDKIIVAQRHGKTAPVIQNGLHGHRASQVLLPNRIGADRRFGRFALSAKRGGRQRGTQHNPYLFSCLYFSAYLTLFMVSTVGLPAPAKERTLYFTRAMAPYIMVP